ncbi:MAG: hypothetical protein H6509_14085 [Bryobacterales bacterium]|nr:hypothetical protein [Acidobacteriota bacterium]MCB9385741.1 hypothetical protein [Bryobacterales bacterium]
MTLRTAAALLFAASLPSQAALHYVIVQGLPGEPRYEERFSEETGKIAEAARATAGDAKRVHLLKDRGATLDKIAETLTQLKNNLNADDTVAVILVGHGSYDGSDYKFNIPGPDLTAARLAGLMDALPAERQLVVTATSSSGAAVDALQGKGRIVITATKSGRERNATVFSRYWAEAFSNPEADSDKNQTITAQEAYQFADAKVKAYFETAKLLASEHPRMEGELASSFTLARLGKSAAILSDPSLQPLVEQREDLQTKIELLKLRKDAMGEGEYLEELQGLLLKLAELEEKISVESAKKEGAQP